MNDYAVAVSGYEDNKTIKFVPAADQRKKYDFKIPQSCKPTSEEMFAAIKKCEETSRGIGMDEFPEHIYNKFIEYLLSSGKYRDACMEILHANFGMRYSDVCRIKLQDLMYFNPDSGDWEFKDYFTLVEKKTSKTRNKVKDKKTGEEKCRPVPRYFYLNDAVKAILSIYLQHCDVKWYEYLFVSQSNNKTYETDDEGRTIQSPLTWGAERDIIKDNLPKIGVFLKNDSRYSGGELRICTHSLRKMYGGIYLRTGEMLKSKGIISTDLGVLKLLQNNFMHSSMTTTQRYCGEMEKVNSIIINEMNIGWSALEQYLENN